MRRILYRMFAGSGLHFTASPKKSEPATETTEEEHEAREEELVLQLLEQVSMADMLSAENHELARANAALRDEVQRLRREVQRVCLLSAARLEFEGARVQTPCGPGLVTYVGHEMEVCLDTGDVFYARYPAELSRLTLPDAKLAAVERRQLKSIRLNPWTTVERAGCYEQVIMHPYVAPEDRLD